MYIELIFKKFSNNNYNIKCLQKDNGYAVVFENDNESFLYSLIPISNSETRLLPSNIDTHNETPLIFNQNIFEEFDNKIDKIINDFNFLNAFCFGKKKLLEVKTLKDIMINTRIDDGPCIEYFGPLTENGSLVFLMEFDLIFNFDTGQIYFKETYTYYTDYSLAINTNDWSSFKSIFLNKYGSNKINKPLNELTFRDYTITQMVNF